MIKIDVTYLISDEGCSKLTTKITFLFCLMSRKKLIVLHYSKYLFRKL